MNRFCCGIIGWDGVAVNEARVAFSASKEHLMKYGRGYHSFTDPIPPELLSNSNAYQDFRRRIMVLDAGYDLPLFTCVCPLSIPFFILLLLGGIGADMQEENEKRGDDNTGPNYQNELWYKALFLVSLIVPFLIAGPLTRPLLEKFDKAVEDTLEEFREEFKEEGFMVTLVVRPETGLCCSSVPRYVSFVRPYGQESSPQSKACSNGLPLIHLSDDYDHWGRSGRGAVLSPKDLSKEQHTMEKGQIVLPKHFII